MHLGGVGAGLAIRRWLAERSGLALGSLGALLGGAGLFLFGQLAA
jgi:urease accessory protein